ncbi:MAG: haloalkane dehalogenase [Pseudomonadota bacterium]
MTDWRERKSFEDVTVGELTRRMAYVADGSGAPVLLLHGNPTSSFLWRRVMAELPGAVRAVAPDLIGMGDSDKLPDSGPGRYRFVEHRAWLDALLSRILPEAEDGPGVTLVLHDWGSALGFDWARRHPKRVRGIVYMEAIPGPITWAGWPKEARPIFQALRSPAGEEMILEKNLFVETILPSSILRTLSDAEMAEYRRPFAQPGEDRRPTLSWPRELPIDREPQDVTAVVQASYDWLRASPVPKLLIDAEPGAIMKGPMLEAARIFPNQTEIQVKGVHFIQEDSGAEIGRAIVDWMAGLEA